MDEHPDWTTEQREMLELLRSKNDVEIDAALAPIAEALEKDPELAQRLEHILAWDSRLSEAVRDVAVPPGLAEQIIQSVEAHSARPMPRADRPCSSRRRRLAWASVFVGAGAAVLLIAIAVMGSVPKMDPGELRSIARDRFVESRDNNLPGPTAVAVPSGFPYSPDLKPMPGVRSYPVADFREARAVAYDIPLGGNGTATLYVVRCRSHSLPQRPPRTPQMRTLDLAIAAWQGDDVVYVLVTEGGEPAYRFLLRSFSGTLA
ncbi:MAG: DUF3379 domain-containing protein [Planctomycetaceae bacterium]|jgi:hypothetical protein|nr:DUF3379 domain-containing protein [Planctomycetaceae bacterium]